MAPDGALDDAIDRIAQALALIEPVAIEIVPDLLLNASTEAQAFEYDDTSTRLSDAWATLRIALTTLRGTK